MTLPRQNFTPLLVELDDDGATIDGATVLGTDPLVRLCRLLLAAGYDPARELRVHCGDVCLPITIGAYARTAA